MAHREGEVKNHFGVAKFEEREHPRFLLSLPVEYYPTKSNIRGLGYTGNASEKGLILYLRRHFKAGDFLKLKLFFSFGPAMNTIEMLSQVIWTERVENKEYRCGIKFVEISPTDMEKFNRFLKNLSPSSH